MKQLTYLSNDSCWAIYLDGVLLEWGQHGDDPFWALKRAGEKLGFTVTSGTLPDLDGDAPKENL